MTAGEDTTAQIAAALTADGYFNPEGTILPVFMPIVLAQVEAAKATARRDAWDEGHAAGKREAAEYLLNVGQAARASAQGAAAPAEVSRGTVTGRKGDEKNRCAICGTDLTQKTCLYNSATDLITCETKPCADAHDRHAFLAYDHAAAGPGCVAVVGKHGRICAKRAEDSIHTQRVPGQPGEQDTAEETTE